MVFGSFLGGIRCGEYFVLVFAGWVYYSCRPFLQLNFKDFSPSLIMFCISSFED